MTKTITMAKATPASASAINEPKRMKASETRAKRVTIKTRGQSNSNANKSNTSNNINLTTSLSLSLEPNDLRLLNSNDHNNNNDNDNVRDEKRDQVQLDDDEIEFDDFINSESGSKLKLRAKNLRLNLRERNVVNQERDLTSKKENSLGFKYQHDNDNYNNIKLNEELFMEREKIRRRRSEYKTSIMFNNDNDDDIRNCKNLMLNNEKKKKKKEKNIDPLDYYYDSIKVYKACLRPKKFYRSTISSQMVMWPTKRQLLVLSFLSIVLTSLLATTLDISKQSIATALEPGFDFEPDNRDLSLIKTNPTKTTTTTTTTTRMKNSFAQGNLNKNCSLFNKDMNSSRCHEIDELDEKDEPTDDIKSILDMNDKLEKLELSSSQDQKTRSKTKVDWTPVYQTTSTTIQPDTLNAQATLRAPTLAPSSSGSSSTTESIQFQSIETPAKETRYKNRKLSDWTRMDYETLPLPKSESSTKAIRTKVADLKPQFVESHKIGKENLEDSSSSSSFDYASNLESGINDNRASINMNSNSNNGFSYQNTRVDNHNNNNNNNQNHSMALKGRGSIYHQSNQMNPINQLHSWSLLGLNKSHESEKPIGESRNSLTDPHSASIQTKMDTQESIAEKSNNNNNNNNIRNLNKQTIGITEVPSARDSLPTAIKSQLESKASDRSSGQQLNTAKQQVLLLRNKNNNNNNINSIVEPTKQRVTGDWFLRNLPKPRPINSEENTQTGNRRQFLVQGSMNEASNLIDHSGSIQKNDQTLAQNQLWQNMIGNTLGQLLTLSAAQNSPQQSNRFNNNNNNDDINQVSFNSQRLMHQPSFQDQHQDTRSLINSLSLFDSGRLQQSEAGSGSAPSVSLPPLSHFFTPRNPFKLFASATIPPVTRIRPAAFFLATTGRQKAKTKGQNVNQNSNQYQYSDLFSAADSRPSDSYINHQAGHESFGLPPPPPPQLITGQDLDLAKSGSRLLYAHSQSVEQLEKLIKASSQIQSDTPTMILPAIVSGPNGPIPGYYIPALDHQTEQQKGNSHRQPHFSSSENSNTIQSNSNHLSSLDAASSSSSAVMNQMDLSFPSASQESTMAQLIASKIPGTDYILHPEEVRAMINIGDLAWKKQLANSEASNRKSNTNSNNESKESNVQSAASNRGQTSVSFNQAQQMQGNLMQENHAENARDFAYIEPSDISRRPASNSDSSRNTIPGSTASVRPIGVIRLKKHQFVRWPPNNHKNSAGDETGRDFFSQQISARPESDLHEQRLLELASAAPNHMTQAKFKPVLRRGNAIQSIQNSASENNMVRMATQLTPHEINMVEDSIIEALLVAQHSTPKANRVLATHSPYFNALPALVAMQNIQQAGSPTFISPMMSPSISSFDWKAPNQQSSSGSSNNNENKNGRRRWLDSLRFRKRNTKPKETNQNQNLNANGRPSFILIGPDSLPSAANTIMSIVPLINVSSLLPNSQLSTNPTLVLHRIEPSLPIDPIRSRYSSHIASPLLADQDTNKQPNWSAKLAESESVISHRVVPYFRSGLDHAQTPPSGFGDRLTGAQISTGLGQAKHANLNKQEHQSENFKLTPLAFQTAVRPTAETTPIVAAAATTTTSDSSGSMNTKLARDNLSLLIGATNDRRQRDNNRINVDWPAMASDADYFPSKVAPHELTLTNHLRDKQHQHDNNQHPPSRPQKDHQSSATTYSGDEIISSQSLSDIRGGFPESLSLEQQQQHQPQPQPRPQQTSNNVREQLQSTTMSGHNNKADNGAHQAKLQFASDYQAREGVPIYNNNVRISGSLVNRQRSSTHLSS